MLAKLARVAARVAELTESLTTPEVLKNPKKIIELQRELTRLQPLTVLADRYRAVRARLDEAQRLLADSDPEVRQLAQDEVAAATAEEATLAAAIKRELLPRDPDDQKHVLIEIRAGTGGEEAALFAGDLFRMYTRFLEGQGWKWELMSASQSEVGGYKEVIFAVNAAGAYAKLKYESGVHRVQRVPATEASGRLHTSAATVAVLPEAEEVDLKIADKDLRIDTFCASGHGGQSVNTTYSAVRITYLPTGVSVSCQDEKSQHKNREKAMKVLRSRLLQWEREKQHSAEAAKRKEMVRTGDRSEKIRTYNWPQNRVTDHRLEGDEKNFSLEKVIDGDLREIINRLARLDEARQLAALETDAG